MDFSCRKILSVGWRNSWLHDGHVYPWQVIGFLRYCIFCQAMWSQGLAAVSWPVWLNDWDWHGTNQDPSFTGYRKPRFRRAIGRILAICLADPPVTHWYPV